MMQSNGQMSRVGAVKVALQRFAFVVLVLSAFTLMLLGKADTLVVDRMRTAVTDAMAPVLEVLSKPAASVASVMNTVRELAHLRQENATLRDENLSLLRWQALARQLQAENQRLRELTAMVKDPKPRFITARVVADSGGVFARSLIVTAGAQHGARKGQVVVSAQGVVGRLTEVGHRASRVLLLTDPNSRVPVLLEESRARAILMGTNRDRPQLAFLKAKAGVSPGDRIVTSGIGRLFPPGLPVGVVSSVDDGHIWVELFIEDSRLELARILDYGPDGIVGDPNAGPVVETAPPQDGAAGVAPGADPDPRPGPTPEAGTVAAPDTGAEASPPVSVPRPAIRPARDGR
ncbi:rod shape-determining protein MreC [Roseospira visakhapatnamensis]|uniref:Cell shape-determining protein MreC n=1 Tax=Roseospira visakhapatnamensis TaxID=390880 RepID=A0A7W6RAX9_9PROT|nr:rod shape-determining protein MreC [Roseospira visakhapatnamensis]MBB4265166.1 rod shape-determining protein MreC [Roseospira visakhapatnamensis]